MFKKSELLQYIRQMPPILLWCNVLVVLPLSLIVTDAFVKGSITVTGLLFLVLLGPIALVTLYLDYLHVKAFRQKRFKAKAEKRKTASH